MVILIVVICFIVVAVGSVTLGRWMQRKGADLERGGKDEPS